MYKRQCFLRQKDTEPYLVTREDLKETLEYVSGYSLYAYEDEIRQGFLSVQGGHRVGVTGKVILDGNRIRGMKYISCINVRLAHEIQGCAEEVLPYIQTREQIMHTLIVSPPRCGKTTLLRDIIRQMSNGWGNISGVTVGVVDERSELAGCYQGIPQNDLGMRTDILDGCPKAEGIDVYKRQLYAIGSGGLFGRGLGNSIQKLGSVPEAQNDMIFSIICEELGIFGGIFVLILFGYLLYRLFFIAQNAPDLFGSLIVTGIFIHIALQVILNIAVVLNLMPNTGVTLPFISYGGTSIVFLMLEMAIALSVARQIKFQE